MIQYPRLYQYARDSTDNMGLGPMKGVLTAQVQRDSNKIPVLTMTYDKDDPLASKIKEGMIIVTSMGPNENEQNQKFRISEVGGDELQSLSITANHIVGDLAYNVITKDISIANASPSDAFNAIKEALADPMPELSFYSDILKVANLGWQFKDAGAVSNLLMGEDQIGDNPTNTMQSLYQGEWVFNNYDLSLMQRGGQDTGLVVKYGRRLKSLTQDTNIDNTYNAIFPYATYSPDTTTEEDGGQDFDGQGVVQYVGAGGAETYNSPYKGHVVNGHVKNGTYYQVEKMATVNTVNDDTWYLIGNGQWIDEHFFTFDKTGAYVVNKITAQGTVHVDSETSEGQGLITNFSGDATIVYTGKGGVALWTSPFVGRKLSGQYLKNGTRWKVFAKATDYNGKVWYCLGNTHTQWIDSQYLSFEKVNDDSRNSTSGITGILQIQGKPTYVKTKKVVPVTTRGRSSTRRTKTITVKTPATKTVSAMTGPGQGKTVTWKPAQGSRWKIGQIATDSQGQTWYQVSTYIWVKDDEDTITFNGAGTVKPNMDAENIKTAQQTGRIPIYNAPNGTRVTDQWLPVGNQVPITAQAESNGKTWYEIGEGKWVDASYFTFENPTDVAPGEGDDSGQDIEVQDVTVTLPNLVMTSPFVSSDERLRIQTVDLSSYNIRDADKLQEVAEQYIKEYRIGYPNVSLTIDYQQICNEVDLYDLVLVQYDELDLQQKAEVNSVIWNPLSRQFTQITIGDLPISYEHLLGQYVENTVQKNTNRLEKKNQHLFGEMHRIVKLQGDDQKAALQKMADQLDISYKSNTNAIEKLKDMVEDINSTVDDVQGWISGSGAGVIRAEPNWQYPTQLTAQTGDGGKMYFSGNGLGYIGSDGVLRSAIDSRGNVVAEAITGGTIKGIALEGVRVTGNSYINSVGDTYSTVMSSQNGFSVSDNNGGGAALNATHLRIGNAWLSESSINTINSISLNGARIFYANGYKGDGLYYHDYKGDHHIMTN